MLRVSEVLSKRVLFDTGMVVLKNQHISLTEVAKPSSSELRRMAKLSSGPKVTVLAGNIHHCFLPRGHRPEVTA